MAEAGIYFARLHHVFYTHLHPDHTGDLVPLLFAKRNTDLRRNEDITLYGPQGFKEYLRRLRDVYGEWIAEQGYHLTLQELRGGKIHGSDWRVTAIPVLHTEGSLGYRIESKTGGVIAYSGDSDVCPGLIELGRGADILILECSFPDKLKAPGHLTPTEAGRIASEAGCRRLILTHFYPVCDKYDIVGACEKTFSGEIILASDLMRLAVS
jgi:ribonuclease BN (tRNA processing enzyme)